VSTEKNSSKAGIERFPLTAARPACAIDVTVSDEAVTFELDDGRTIAAPLGWFPRLVEGTRAERKNWRLVGKGLDVHWPDLDEDIEVQHVVLGVPSLEGDASLQRWLDERAAKKKKTSTRKKASA
jgi:Protein of unknown function (DUF2442)